MRVQKVGRSGRRPLPPLRPGHKKTGVSRYHRQARAGLRASGACVARFAGIPAAAAETGESEVQPLPDSVLYYGTVTSVQTDAEGKENLHQTPFSFGMARSDRRPSSLSTTSTTVTTTR